MALLCSTWLHSYHGFTSLYVTLLHSTMGVVDSTWLYFTVSWLYFSLLGSTLLYTSFTRLYITLPWLYFYLLDSTYFDSTSFAIALLDSISFYHGSITLYLRVPLSTTNLLDFTWLYFTLLYLPWLYFTLLDVILPCFYIIYFSSMSLYLTLLHCTMLCVKFLFSFCLYCSISVAHSFTPWLV